MKYQMILDYTVPVGDLEPYFEALQEGIALASACGNCGAVAFPARTRCGICGGVDMQWKQLAGSAHVLFRTDTRSGSFALVKFVGADTGSTVGLIDSENKVTTGRLAAATGDRPGLWLVLDAQEKGK